ncbi:MAG: SAM-dependent methyltransferase [Bacteroidetes bacterium]|nr:MAG: SAM-dependent methyltransferase [Bacteroidota bacterium]
MLGPLISWTTRVVPRPLLHRGAVMAGWCLAQCLRGSTFRDPIDGFGYRRLLPYGRIQRRPNALAPKSLSLERHRLIWLYLSSDLDILHASLRVLHIAPEWCLMKRLEAIPSLMYTTADLESPWAKVHCDIQALPFADDSFDLILCNHVLEHIPDDHLAMTELRRVLSPGGTAILLVPLDLQAEQTLEDPAINTPELREKHYGQRDHLRMYGRDYPERLAKAGFQVQMLNYASTLSEQELKKYALGQETLLVIAS